MCLPFLVSVKPPRDVYCEASPFSIKAAPYIYRTQTGGKGFLSDRRMSVPAAHPAWLFPVSAFHSRTVDSYEILIHSLLLP